MYDAIINYEEETATHLPSLNVVKRSLVKLRSTKIPSMMSPISTLHYPKQYPPLLRDAVALMAASISAQCAPDVC